MKSIKRLSMILVCFVCAVCLFVVTSCSNSNEKVKIGLIMYQWNDAQGKEIQSYCNYLEDNMDLEFEYASTYYQDDQHLSCVQDLIASGCNAIIAGYDTSLVASLDTCKEAGVYYAVSLDYVSKDDFKDNEVSEYFVGGTSQFGGNTNSLGEIYAEACNNQNVSNVCGVSFPVWAFSDGLSIYNGFSTKLKSLNASAVVADLVCSEGFDQANITTATNTALSNNPDAQAIFGLSSGLDFVYPVIQNTNVKLISLGYNDSVKSLFESNKIIAAGTNNQTQSIASCIARIINAIDGNAYKDQANGAYNLDGIVNGVAGYPVMTNLEEVNDYLSYVYTTDMSKCSVTVEELKNCIIRYNSEATLESLNKLTNRTLLEIKAERTK